MMGASKLDAIQAQVKKAVAKAASEYGERNKHKPINEKQKKEVDKDGLFHPVPPRGFVEKVIRAEVAPGALFDALLDDNCEGF